MSSNFIDDILVFKEPSKIGIRRHGRSDLQLEHILFEEEYEE